MGPQGISIEPPELTLLLYIVVNELRNLKAFALVKIMIYHGNFQNGEAVIESKWRRITGEGKAHKMGAVLFLDLEP